MKQKHLYLILTGCIDSLDYNSGYEQLNTHGTYSSFKAALKEYNAIKGAKDWAGAWGVAEIQRVLKVDYQSYLSGDLVNTDLLRQHLEPQRGNNQKAIEFK